MAPTIHAIASEYHTDPYTVVFEWSYERWDFNLNILNRAKTVEAEAMEKAHKKAQRKR